MNQVIALVGSLALSLGAAAQVSESPREIVLPNPQLIHCHSAECSQLWKQHSHDGRTAYPAQVRTDIVDGEIVGLTAVYDKSSSTTELRAAIDALYGKWQVPLHSSIGVWLWRVEPEQIAIQLADREDGVKQLIFLKFANAKSQLTPSAHIDQEDHGRGCK